MNDSQNSFIISGELDAARILGQVDDGRFLLLVFHGYTGDNRDIYDTVRNAIPPHVQAGISIVSIRAPIDLSKVPAGPGEGFAWFLFDDPDSYKTLAQSAQQIIKWLDTKKAAGVGVLGFSQGGAVCIELLRQAPEKFCFAVNASGFVWGPPRESDASLAVDTAVRYGSGFSIEKRKVEVFWGLGKEDTILPYQIWESTESWLVKFTNPTIRIYPGLAHKICDEEVRDISSFLVRHLENRVGRISPGLRCRWKEQDLSGKNVVLLLHGYGSSETELIRWTGPEAAQHSLTASDGQYLPENTVYISLQAPIPEAMGYAWFSKGEAKDAKSDVGGISGSGSSANAGLVGGNLSDANGAGDIANLANLNSCTGVGLEVSGSAGIQVDTVVNSVVDYFRDIVQNFGKPAKVAVLGFSQGGAVGIELILRHPEIFDCAVVLGGYALEHKRETAVKKPILWLRGDADAVIKPDQVQTTRRILEASSSLTEECVPGLAHEITPEVIERVRNWLALCF